MPTKYDLVTARHGGRLLHGLLHRKPDHQGLVLHVHGTWGNFYGDPFVPWFAEVYDAAGLSFASVNFPGHDETAIDEKAQDSADAFPIWLDVLRRGQEPLVLQGHSLGAIKIAYLASARGLPPGTVGLVLLAPFDSVAFNSRSTGGDLTSLHSSLRTLIGSGQTLVPKNVFAYWPVSPQTLIELTTPGGPWDQFPTRNGEAGSALKSLQVPTLAIFGTEDFAVTPDPQAVVDIASSVPSVVGALVDRAPHSFAGQEPALMKIIAEWINARVSHAGSGQARR